MLALKTPVTTAVEDILISSIDFSEKISFGISCESSALQMIHMKYQALFSLKKKKNKYFRRLSATILNGTLRVKREDVYFINYK